MQANTLKSQDIRERIRELVEAGLRNKGVSGRLASFAIVGHDGLIRDIRAGRLVGIDKLDALFEYLGLELYFGPPRDTAPAEQMFIDGKDFAHIPLHGASLAAGGGAMNEGETVIDHLAFRRSWLTRIGVSASSARLARATGDSMMPTIHPGDMLLIDTSKDAPPDKPRSPKDTRPAPIYALLDDGAARVKRLALVDKNNLGLLSDNHTTPPEFRPISDVKIIGKVMWWGHTNKE
ncbi:S24 family peptidase [Pseudotabrizicola algicola]|uniref:Helix-turn-helix transcriptional regulator n=1 Tax=Pseudotabrizicola algicola TaxID=2709381 RepID=A0A6B3RNK2_9RHOB|nr:helix-turn-helix transcriptional regulator [Pseudotabrizicola algicola]NEX47640.1 helix-turn-helix transcriptional regulator [Pseudotabrizicola algicola]